MKPGRKPIEIWNGELRERLHDCTIVGELTDLGGEVIAVVQQFGFAIVESTPGSLSEAAVAQRSQDLLAFGTRLGTPLFQSPRHELVEDVKDYSDLETGDTRGYRSGGELKAHSDPPTLVVLHCLGIARAGGDSSLVRVAAIVARMEEMAPRLAEELFAPLPSWRVPGQNGIDLEGPDEPKPVLTNHQGNLSCVLYRPHIHASAEASGQSLTTRQLEALDLFEACSMDNQLTLRFLLKPGQTLIIHNRSVLHARTDYQDWPEMNRRRHLLRLWIDAPESFLVDPSHELGDFFPA